ncbi:DUF7948 domain-containing protein, partial [Desulfogranum mediterraneum]|uniref:DUF7948 domain-containing protein n=1 Tax=Desulfogranum mediterraneum TaxID=160661 RepID=UPI00055147E5
MKKRTRPTNTLICEELEPRLLFSADGAEALAVEPAEQVLEEEPVIVAEIEAIAEIETIAVELPAEIISEEEPAGAAETVEAEPAAADPTAATEDEMAASGDGSGEVDGVFIVTEQADGTEVAATTEQASETAAPTELVIVNGDVPDKQHLVDELLEPGDSDPVFEVVVLDEEVDGVFQVTQVLEAHQDLDAIHFISDGSDGQINMGSTWLDSASLQENRDTLSAWGDALNEDGDILFYGSNIAGSGEGEALLATLSEIIGGDVAASDDVSGHEFLGGDWELEKRYGSVESAALTAGDPASDWQHTLDRPSLEASYLSSPLAFEENDGQTDEAVDFLARGSGYTVFLSNADAVLLFDGQDSSHVVRLNVVGASPAVSPQGETVLASRSNYLLGSDSSNWQTGVEQFGSVLYEEVYNGIDLRYYGNQRQLEYDFVVAAGAESSDIQLNFEGAEAITVNAEGELVITLSGENSISFKAPVSYQYNDAGVREEVASSYCVHDDGTIGFQLGAYDAARELVIDPILDYATFLGGTGVDEATDIAVDASGNIYLTGHTTSTDFPGTEVGTGAVKASSDQDVFVIKLSADGSSTLYSTYLGGTSNDQSHAIAVDSSGNVYLSGSTQSADLAIVGGAASALGGAQDAFVAKLNAAGDTLLYSSYFGGTGDADTGYGIALDPSGNAYITGQTDTPANKFPDTSGVVDSSFAGASEAFIAKFNPTLSGTGSLVYATYLGGDGSDSATDIAVDASGNAYVGGWTTSTDFATSNGFRTTGNGTEGFVTKLNPTASSILYSTYVGGTAVDYVKGLTLDGNNNLYLVGQSNSSGMATAGANQTTLSGGYEGFLMKLDPTQSGADSQIYATYLGGDQDDSAEEVAVDSSGRAHVTGTTSSALTATGDAFDSTINASIDEAFLMIFDPAGANLDYASYIGGMGSDSGNSIVLDSAENIYIAGTTTNVTFDNVSSPNIVVAGGSTDAFVVKFLSSAPPAIDLDSDDSSGATSADFAAAWIEGNGPVGITDALDAALTDADSTHLESLTVTISNPADGAAELLAADTTGTSISASYDADNNILTLFNPDTIANYQQVLRTISYDNTSTVSDTSAREITFVATDGNGNSNLATTTLTINGINSAPVHTVPGTQTIAQDTTLLLSSASGNAISISDDAGANDVEVTLSATNGTLSLNLGTNEALVNTTTGGIQSSADIAYTGDGSSVVVWQHDTGTGFDIYAQRVDSIGNTVGSEILVSQAAYDEQTPHVAMDASGNFVVVWKSLSQDKSGTWGVYGRHYDSSGTPLNTEFQVNTLTTGDQTRPDLAMNASGEFVVVWEGNGTGDADGIFFQRYNSDGVAQGGETLANTFTSGKQIIGSAGMDDAGNVVIVWQSYEQVSANTYTPYGQRFDASGNKVGTEFRINQSYTGGFVQSVDMNSSGQFVVVWQGTNDIWGRSYDATGASLGGDFLVADNTGNGVYTAPRVAVDASGDFAVSWTVPDDGDGTGVFVREFDSTGTPTSVVTQVSESITGSQTNGDIAVNPTGGYAVVYSGVGTGDTDGVFLSTFGSGNGSLNFTIGDGTDDTTMTLTGTIAEINTALDGLVFTPESGYNGYASITLATNDLGNTGSGDALSDTDTIQIAVGNSQAPVVDLDANNSSGAGGANFATIWTVGGGSVAIVDSDLAITDLDSVNLGGCQIEITNPLDGASEILAADTTGTTISALLDGAVLRLTGEDTIAHYEQVLRTVSYNNTAPSPDTTERVLTFSAYDSDANLANIATTTITVTASNQAPVDLQVTATTDGGLKLNTDGGNDVYFVADDGSGLLGGLTALTIEASFSIDTPGADLSPLLSYAAGTNDEELALFLKHDGRIWFGEHSNGSYLQSTTGSYTQLFDGEKHHVAVSWDASNGGVVFYIDGQQVESFTGYQQDQPVTGGGQLVFGQDQDSVLGGFKTIDVFSGSLYDIRIFSDIRTANEVENNFNQTLSNTESGMIANWTFNDLSTAGIVTETVSSNNLTEQHVAGFTPSTPELTLRIAEDAANGTVVGSVAALDPDSDEIFEYTLVDSADGCFAIDSATGQLALSNRDLLDYETAASHNITIRVTDSGDLTYDESFTVNVIDVNEAPVTVDESFTAVEGIPFTAELGLNDLLLNDTDPDGDTLSVKTTPVTGPANGSLELNGDGTFTYTANNNFNGTDSFVYEVQDDKGGIAQGTATLTVQPREIRILFTTQSDVSNSKVPGIADWDAGEVLGIGDPNLSFEPVGSDGSILPYMDLEAFAASTDMTINGLHFVSNDITVGGASSVDLQRGDLLFVSDLNDTMTSTNSLAINGGDVIVFRPNAVDDYSSGIFIHLLDQPGTAKTTGVTLIENDVLIGDVTLQAGTFLFTQESIAEESSIYHFSADDVGAGTTTGTVSTLISSVDIGVSYNNFVGVMVISEDLYLDGAMVPAGSIVTTLAGGQVGVGDNSIFIDEDEIFYLTVTSTTMGSSGTTAADATLLFDGGDVGLNNNQKKIRSLAIIEEISAVNNVDPMITLAVGSISYTESDPATLIDPAAVLTDPDSLNFSGGLLRVDLSTTGSIDDRLAVRNEGVAAGQVGISGTTVTYGGIDIGTFAGGTDGSDPLTVLFNSNADGASVEAVMRNVTFENISTDPSTTQRSVEFSLTDGDGGSSIVVAKTIIINDVNAAPVITGANDLTAIDEDMTENSGTLVSDLITGWVTDTDPGALAGIAVVDVDNTNGSWEFSTDSGTSWTSFGTPTVTDALLLAANADTFVRFVPDSNWNGSVTDGITFHAWDQTSGVSGDSVDITGSANVRDQFDSVSYSNNDGTAVWTSDWVEYNDNDLAASGNVRIENGMLRVDSLDGGEKENVSRSVDLSSATTAILTFDYDGFSEGGTDIVAFEISSDGGSTWTELDRVQDSGITNGGSKSYNLESFTTLTADMQLRFRIVQGLAGTTQHINFDNVDIAYTGTGLGGSSSVSTATASSSIIVNAVDDAAGITGDISYSGNEGDSVAGDLDASDVDGLTDSSYFTVSSAASKGTAAIDAETGAWTFTPTDSDWFGSDAFTVTVTDDLGGITTQVVSITLANVDDAAVITGNIDFSGA